MLSDIYVAVEYYDHHVKCQAWPSEFIAQTDRLVFSPDFMEEPERRAFGRIHRNWRRNPCMCRYPINDGDPELICQRGDDRTWRLPRLGAEQPAQVRGWPVGIEFRYVSNGGEHSYHFGESWVSDTGALHFRPDPAHNGGFAITRVERDGSKTNLNVMAAGSGGPMPCRVLPDSYPCWYGSHAKAKRR
jgi:hypothetical protein